MKTLQEIKDEQAQSVGYADWDAIFEQIIKDKDLDSLEWNMDIVAKRYAEQAIDECAKEADLWYDEETDSDVINSNTILNVKLALK